MDPTSETIGRLQIKLHQVEEEVNKIKKAINLLCEIDGKQAMYAETDGTSCTVVKLKGDEFHNIAQATAITEIMERRRNSNLAPVTIDEIYDDLIAGGFQFTKGKNEAIQKRGLAITMSKNRKFYKLPNDKWGIKSWYNIKDTKNELNDSQPPKPEPEDSNPDDNGENNEES